MANRGENGGKESWYLLKFLRANEVLSLEEKIGGNEMKQWQIAGFHDAGNDCQLTGLGFHGLTYTWDNRQEEGSNVKARLDRAWGDNKFMEAMGESEVFHIQLVESDHADLLVEVRERAPASQQGRRRPKPFRYENMWKDHGEYMEFVNQSWDPGPGSTDLAAMVSALHRSKRRLKMGREVFGSVKKQIKELRAELEEERGNTLYRGPTVREREIMAKLSNVLARK